MSIQYEERSSPVSILLDSGLSHLPHIHKEIEIVYIEEGSSEMFADRNHTYAKAGDLFIAFPNQVHYYKSSPAGKFHVAIASPKILLGLDSALTKNIPHNNVIHMENDSSIQQYFEKMQKADGKYAMTELCGYFNLIMSKVMPSLELKPLIQSNHSTVSQILDYCNQNFKNEITLDEVSKALHLSKYYISHIINKQLNLSFNDYINSLRISCACDMLKETDAKIADVSEEVGFGTIRSFNRVFRELMDATPGDYRKIFGEKEL